MDCDTGGGEGREMGGGEARDMGGGVGCDMGGGEGRDMGGGGEGVGEGDVLSCFLCSNYRMWSTLQLHI